MRHNARRLKGLNRFKDRLGNWRVYYRAPGRKAVKLPDLPESHPDFLLAYIAASTGEATAQPAKRTERPKETVSRLIDKYLNSIEFANFSKYYRRDQRLMCRRIEATPTKKGGTETIGDLPYKHLEPQHIRADIRKLQATPHAANGRLKVWRCLFNFAIEENLVTLNPAALVKKLKATTKGFPTWTEDQIEAFESYWPVGSPPRTAFDLLLHTGQRRGDVCAFGRQHVKSGRFSFVQSKTGAKLILPITLGLQRTLDAIPADQLQFIVTETGKARSANAFGSWFKGKCEEANVFGVSAHGLRKAAAVRLINAGSTTAEAAAFTGHASLKELEVYIKERDQERLAARAVANMARTKKP